MGRILRWLLLALVIAGVAFYFYQRNIAAVPVSAADLEKGGAYSDAEKSTLKTACANLVKKDSDKVCGYIADKAGEASHYQRMVMTAMFQEKPADVIGLAKGLIASGIPAVKMKAAEEDAKKLHQDMKTTCGAG